MCALWLLQGVGLFGIVCSICFSRCGFRVSLGGLCLFFSSWAYRSKIYSFEYNNQINLNSFCHDVLEGAVYTGFVVLPGIIEKSYRGFVLE